MGFFGKLFEQKSHRSGNMLTMVKKNKKTGTTKVTTKRKPTKKNKQKQMIKTDVSGKWVSIDEVLKLLERLHELEKQLYGSR